MILVEIANFSLKLLALLIVLITSNTNPIALLWNVKFFLGLLDSACLRTDELSDSSRAISCFLSLSSFCLNAANGNKMCIWQTNIPPCHWNFSILIYVYLSLITPRIAAGLCLTPSFLHVHGFQVKVITKSLYNLMLHQIHCVRHFLPKNLNCYNHIYLIQPNQRTLDHLSKYYQLLGSWKHDTRTG